MGVEIVIPSRKRSEMISTSIPGAILFIDEKEKKDYAHLKDSFEIVTHKSLGSLAEIRNAIYKKFGDVFMVDDDIVSVERLYTTEGQKMTGDEIVKIINECYYNSIQIGATLFGFNNNPNPTHYNQHKPFMLKGYINGCAIGLRKDPNLFFTKKTTACESHWINLLNAYYNRFCFIDKRFHFRQADNSTFQMIGGQAGKRTLLSEKEDTLFLRKMFGDSVVMKKQINKTNQLHQYQRQLKIRL